MLRQKPGFRLSIKSRCLPMLAPCLLRFCARACIATCEGPSALTACVLDDTFCAAAGNWRNRCWWKSKRRWR